jgi:general secretion pathway protein G
MIKVSRTGLSLLEMLAAVTILGILASIVVPRLGGSGRKAKIQACAMQKNNIEVQVQLWFRSKNAWPANNLSDIGADVRFFPEPVATCPVDGTTYSIDGTTHRVVGHNH